jgi:hypothetical protein
VDALETLIHQKSGSACNSLIVRIVKLRAAGESALSHSQHELQQPDMAQCRIPIGQSVPNFQKKI